MRLLYITQSFGGGASGIFSRNLVRKFTEKGIGVDVLTLNGVSRGTNGFNLHTVPVFGRHAFYKFELPMFGLIKLMSLLKNKYDIIHSQDTFPGFLGHIAKLKTRKTHILVKEMVSNYPTLHGKVVIFFEKNFITKLKYDKLVSWSKSHTKTLIEWGVPKEKIEMIPGGIDLNEIPDETERIKKYKHFENVVAVTKPLYTTNTWGIVYIILAMKYLVKEFPDIKLLIAGGGVGRPYLQRMTRELSISRNVIFLGRLPHREALALQRVADVLPHSFVYEPTTSIALLESMASGTPIVCTDSGEAKYLLKDCGILVKPKNPKSIANGIKKVLTDKKLGDRLSKKALRKVKNKYTIEKIAKQYTNLYSSFY